MPTGRVDDDVVGARRHERDHEFDDVAGRAELAVLAGRGDLGQQVFIQVALGVAAVGIDRVQQVDDLGEQGRIGDRERRILHLRAIGRIVRGEPTQKGEDVLTDEPEHFVRGRILEARPAEAFVWGPAIVVALGEDAPLHRLARAIGPELRERMKLVEAAKEKQVGDLLDCGQRVGDASRPQGVPDAVDLALEFAIDHVARLICGSDRFESRLKLVLFSLEKRLRSSVARRIVEHVFE